MADGCPFLTLGGGADAVARAPNLRPGLPPDAMLGDTVEGNAVEFIGKALPYG